jgi:hypothetical protein
MNGFVRCIKKNDDEGVLMGIGRFIGLVSLLTLGGCSASSMIVRSYDGDALPSQQVARVVVPADIKLESIDGKEQKQYLLDSLALTYEMLPGSHTLVYRYSEIWAKPPGGPDEAKVETVESGLRQLAHDFKAGDNYELTFSRPKDRMAAKAATGAFSAWLVTVDGKKQASDTAYVPSAPVPQGGSPMTTAAVVAPVVVAPAVAATVAPTAGGAIPAKPAPASSTSGLSRLDALKALWSDTSAEDKKAFLQWAFK